MKSTRGYSLIEMLTVLLIISVMVALSTPVMRSVITGNSVDKASNDLTRTLEESRAFAMAHGTYVRVGFGTLPSSATRALPAVVVLSLYAPDGTLGVSDMTQWNKVGIPLVMNNFNFNDALGTSTDITPDTTTISTLTQSIGSVGPVTFNSWIQFGPMGTARVNVSSPVRFIKVPLDLPAPQAGTDPFVIRLEGLTGAMQVLRKENL